MFNYQETKADNTDPYKVDQRTQFNELVVGAGTQQTKMVRTGVKFQDKHYFIKGTTSLPILQLDQDSNISFSADGSGKGELVWPSGNYIKALGATIEIGGDIIGSAGISTTGYTVRVGSHSYSGITHTFKDRDGNDIVVRGGIVTNT